MEEPLGPLCERFWHETERHWRNWVKHCDIPPLYQQQVIRSALALKLHCFEDTGAILAALTTSLPEQPGGTRNWDYRYCWMRDAFFVVRALNRIGATRTMEDFISYILSIAAGQSGSRMPSRSGGGWS